MDEDFTDLTADFSLTPDVPQQCFNVSITDDDILELIEFFRASLTVVGVLPQEALFDISAARVEINDNECEPLGCIYMH